MTEIHSLGSEYTSGEIKEVYEYEREREREREEGRGGTETEKGGRSCVVTLVSRVLYENVGDSEPIPPFHTLRFGRRSRQRFFVGESFKYITVDPLYLLNNDVDGSFICSVVTRFSLSIRDQE